MLRNIKPQFSVKNQDIVGDALASVLPQHDRVTVFLGLFRQDCDFRGPSNCEKPGLQGLTRSQCIS